MRSYKMGLIASAVLGWVLVGAGQDAVVVSLESDGVLSATGMVPGSTGYVEWASSLEGGFVGTPLELDFVADSNGTMRMAIPMFFRVRVATNAPVGMVRTPAGTNGGINPLAAGETHNYYYPETYDLAVSAFFMDQCEMTKGQWDAVYVWAVMHGYAFDNAGVGQTSDHPVVSINWYDSVKWCNARSEMEGRIPCYSVSNEVYRTGQYLPDCHLSAGGYRLPTNVEWEYAARGGAADERFPFSALGDVISHDVANYHSSTNQVYDVSATRGYHPTYATVVPYSAPAGSFAANGYGLYDMAGNAAEFCTDWKLGLGVLRGGGWGSYADKCRIGGLVLVSPGEKYSDAGFRTVIPAY